MEPVLFYGVPMGCSFGSIVALEWLDQPYRLCRIHMPEENQAPLFGQVNPVRETPAMLMGDGTTISQSAAILQHIAARGAEQGLAFSPGSREYDRFNERLAFLNTTFFASFSSLWQAYEMEENPPVQTVLREVGRKSVAKAHAQLEAMLANSEWIAGNRQTLADAYFVGVARWATYHKAVDPSRFPRVQRLIERLSNDPAVIFAQAIEEQRPATSAGGFRGHVTLEELRPRLAA